VLLPACALFRWCVLALCLMLCWGIPIPYPAAVSTALLPRVYREVPTLPTFRPAGVPEPEHVHPFQESGFEMLSGSLHFRIGSEECWVGAGQSIAIPARRKEVPRGIREGTEAHGIAALSCPG
jgi:hypothetical protein